MYIYDFQDKSCRMLIHLYQYTYLHVTKKNYQVTVLFDELNIN